MDLTNPLVVQFQADNGHKNDRQVHQSGDVMQVPTNLDNWNDFVSTLQNNYKSGKYDSTIVSMVGIPPEKRHEEKTLNSLDIKMKAVLREADNVGNRVFNRYNKQLYYLNPTFDEKKSLGKSYAPKNETILNRYKSYKNNKNWEKHQSDVLKRFKTTMPLTSGQKWERSNHLKMLEAPKRGLNKSDLKDFFSWKSNKPISPELYDDDMIGIPAVKATSYNDIHLSYHGKKLDTTPLSLQTIGMEGYMIPMRNLQGDSPKYQIGTDISDINLILKARAADGVSIQKSEYYDKHANNGRGKYNFKLNGEPSELTVAHASDDQITMSDTKGEFNVPLKKDIKPLLEKRGYELPPIIDNLKPEPNSKYIWMSKGDMIGLNKPKAKRKKDEPKFNDIISPSQAGFISARKPKNGSHDYVVVVAEGALKGTIAAKYFDAKDKNGKSVGDKIAKDKGIIVSQVPGVAASFVKSVDRIYKDPQLKGRIAGTYIAMDADGRSNKNVCHGIHSAFNELKTQNDGKVKIMSWNPKQKGIDDSLLAISRHQITVDQMDIHFGTPEQLFPLDKAEAPNPYKLDGRRANQTWQTEYHKDAAIKEKQIQEAQQNSTKVSTAFDNDKQKQSSNKESHEKNQLNLKSSLNMLSQSKTSDDNLQK